MQSRILDSDEKRIQKPAEFLIRPMRFCYIINRNTDEETLKQIYQFNTSHWGGKYNFFLPTDGETIRSDWLRQLVIHDPDTIFLVGDVERSLFKQIYFLIQPMQILYWKGESLGVLTGELSKPNAILMDDILEEILFKKGKLQTESSLIRYPKFTGQFANYFDIRCGIWLPESGFQKFAEINLGASEQEFIISDLDNFLQAIDEIEKILTPLDLTVLTLARYYPDLSFNLYEYHLIITDGLIDDLFLQHALSWSDQRLQDRRSVAVPYSLLKTEDDYKVLAEWFGKKVRGNTFTLNSHSVELKSLRDIREQLKRYLPYRRAFLSGEGGWIIPIERCNIGVDVPDLIHLKKEQMVEVSKNRLTFPMVGPDFHSPNVSRRNENRYWICDINLSPGFGNKTGFKPSKFPELNFLLSNVDQQTFQNVDQQTFQYRGTRIRIARGYLALQASLKNNIVRIVLPDDQKLIETACKNAGFTIERGNSIYYQGMLNLIGNIEDANFLHDTYILNFFSDREVIRGKAFTVPDLFKRLRVPKTSWDSFRNWVQILAGKEILLRGYNVPCPVCGLEEWYELNAFSEQMQCAGCRSIFQPPIHLVFAYKVNQLFLDSENQGVIAVLLTMFLLHNTAQDFLHWQADVKLRRENTSIELDIIAMCDGVLVIAECKNRYLPYQQPKETDSDYEIKKNEAIEKLKEQLNKEILVSQKLGAHLFLFASLEENAPTEILDFIQDANEKNSGMCIRSVSADELKNGKIFNPDHLVSIFDIAGKYILPPYYKNSDCSEGDDTAGVRFILE